MSKLFLRLMSRCVGIGMTAAACQDDGYRRTARRVPAGTGLLRKRRLATTDRFTLLLHHGTRYSQAAPNYNPTDGRRYTSVTVTNRGQNGYRDDVVQQQVVCGSQYYDGYRTRTAPRC